MINFPLTKENCPALYDEWNGREERMANYLRGGDCENGR